MEQNIWEGGGGLSDSDDSVDCDDGCGPKCPVWRKKEVAIVPHLSFFLLMLAFPAHVG